MKRIPYRYLFVALLLVACYGKPAGAAEYAHLNWLSRVRAATSSGQTLVMNSFVAVSSDKSALYVFDRETGARWWSYGFSGPAKIYAGAGDTLFALADQQLHRLNLRARERVWTMNAGPSGGITVVFDPATDITLVRDAAGHCVAVERDGASRTCPTSIPERGAPPVDFGAPAADIVSPDTKLVIEDRAAVLQGDGGRIVWRVEFNAVLAKTAARVNDRLYLLKADGTLVSVNIQTGEKLAESDLKQLIRMKLWDELPENIDNYANARIEAVDGRIYLSVNSAVARVAMLAFPGEMSLRPSGQSTIEWALNKTLSKWDARDYPGALDGFQTVSEAYPDSAEAQMFLGMAYAAMRRPDDAVRTLENAQRLDPANPDIVNNLAGNYLARAMSLNPKTDTDKIIDFYNKAVGIQPEISIPYIGLAELYLNKGRYEDAEKILLKADKAGFFGEDIYTLAASALYTEKKYDEALAISAQATGLFPSTRLFRVIRAKCYFDIGRYRNAVQELRVWTMNTGSQTSTTYPIMLSAGADYVLGTSLGMLGRYTDAAAALERQLKAIPDRADMERRGAELRNRMSSSKNANDENNIQAEGRKLILGQAESDYLAPTLLALSRFAIAAGDIKSATKWLDRLNNVYDMSTAKDAQLGSDIGYLQLLAGVQTASAEVYISTAYAAQPDNPVLMKNQAMLLWKVKKEFFAAEDLYKKIIAVQSRTEFLHYDYALMMMAQNKFEEAAELFRQETKVSPESTAGRDGLKLLESIRAGKRKSPAPSLKPKPPKKPAQKPAPKKQHAPAQKDKDTAKKKRADGGM